MKKLDIYFRYLVAIEDGINYPINLFKKYIKSILSDSRSWCVNFIEDKINPDFCIILSKRETIINICNLVDLSCADFMKNIIYINYNNWINGSKLSKLTLDDYRTYVINHEVGHILGIHTHFNPRKGCKTPVMNQSTNGIGKGLPNQWPTLREQKIIHSLYK